MQVANQALGADHALAVEFELHAQHAVRGRVLRPHVQDEFVRAQQRLLLLSGSRDGVASHARLLPARHCPLSMPRFSFTQLVSCSMMS